MAGSYRSVNYSIRLGKAIERKMLCDAFRRLYPFGKIETYRYIGFGSIYFSDFSLFHRALGVDNMLSIEKDAYAKASFEFNKPYRCVQIDYRPASHVLPGLDWSQKTVAWLDYDGSLTDEVLSDVTTICARASSGTMLLASVNVEPEKDPSAEGRQQYSTETGLEYDVDAYRLRALRHRIGDAVPADVTGSHLRGKGLANVSRRVINAAIEEALSARNNGAADTDRMSYKQVFHILYKDGARMLSVGGVFYRAADREKLETCSFEELQFVRSGDEPYEIRVPCLTLKEMRYISELLPKARVEGFEIELEGVPASDIRDFTELYRYFPTFTEAVLT